MNVILILLGCLVGCLGGYKYGHNKGLDASFVVVEASQINEVVKEIAKAPKSAKGDLMVLLDRGGFEVFIDEE